MSKCALLSLASMLAVFGSALPAQAAVPTGPAGNGFYNPAASKLKGGVHGDPVWIRNGQSALQVDGASKVVNIVYKSQSLGGAAIPVSGTIWVPKGTAPKGGWPVISWGH